MTERRPIPRHPRYSIDRNGVVYGKTGKPLRLFVGTGGYLRFTTYENGKWQQVSVHVMACETWHGLRPEGMQATHRNGVPTDNSAKNLSWKTAAENEADKDSHGTKLFGEKHHRHKLTEDQAREALRCSGTAKEVARRFNVSPSTIAAVRSGQNWKHLHV